MPTTTLPIYGIEIVIKSKKRGSGVISSDLHSQLVDPDDEQHIQDQYSAAADALESMILGHALAGVDVTTPAYVEGIKTAVQSIANNLG